MGGKGHNRLCLLGHPDLQSWKQNRASLRLVFMLAQPAKNLPLVLSAPAAVQKRLELSVLGRGSSSCLPGGGEQAFG